MASGQGPAVVLTLPMDLAVACPGFSCRPDHATCPTCHRCPLSAGFRKFLVHNVSDLELLLMHNRWAEPGIVPHALALGIRWHRSNPPEPALCTVMVYTSSVHKLMAVSCKRRTYAAEIAHNVSSLKRKAIVDRAAQVGSPHVVQ